MQLPLLSISPPQRPRALSPFRELGAYEALWLEPGATFARIAEKFRTRPGACPSDFIDPATAERTATRAIELAARSGLGPFHVRIHGAGEYPASLRDARHPVELLYYQGVWALAETRCISVVGTRKPSPAGLKSAETLTAALVDRGWTIVSGLAAGIDTAAHETALRRGGRTIAVLGTPICDTYPATNADLQRRIARDWLVLSQVPICRHNEQTADTNRFFFPERNATMSALSEATLIIEAGDTSGTLIQAREALHQRRKVLILAACFERPGLRWPAQLERQGAHRVRDIADIESILGAPARPH